MMKVVKLLVHASIAALVVDARTRQVAQSFDRPHSQFLKVDAGLSHAGALVVGLKSILAPMLDWEALGRSAVKQDVNHSQAGGRTAFIFMVGSGFEFPELWEAFFREADSKFYTILVHATSEVDAQKLPALFRKYLVPTLESKWCHLTRAQFSLARSAFKDPSVEHVVWLSGDAVPLKTFEQVRLALEPRRGESVFCTDRKHDRAEMWNVLARRHASALLNNEAKIFSAFQTLGEKTPDLCEDEDMYWAPLNLMGFGDQLVEQCFMWDDWTVIHADKKKWKNKKGHSTMDGGVGDELLTDLGPKSKRDMLEAPWLAKLNSNYKMWGVGGHPWTFEAVPLEGLKSLVHDQELWFARKFVKTGPAFKGGVFISDGSRVGSIGEVLLNLTLSGNTTRRSTL